MILSPIFLFGVIYFVIFWPYEQQQESHWHKRGHYFFKDRTHENKKFQEMFYVDMLNCSEFQILHL